MMGVFGKVRAKALASGSPYWHARRMAAIALRPASYCRGLALASATAATLTREERACLEGLREAGFSPAANIVDPSLSEDVSAEIGRRLAQLESLSRAGSRESLAKNFWDKLIRDEDMRPDCAFVRYALQPRVVRLAATYLKAHPYLTDVQVVVSRHIPGQQWRESQLWHQDYDDTRIMKLFVYFTDCLEEADGPFTFLKKAESARVPNKLIPRRITDEEMPRYVPASDFSRVLLPRPGPFLIDTAACYHMGSRVAPGRLRIAYIATFTTRYKLYPDLRPRMPDFLGAGIEKLLLTQGTSGTADPSP